MNIPADQARRRELLRGRRIQFAMLSEQEYECVFHRFVKEFISEKKRESLILNFRRPDTKQKPVDYHRYFVSGCKVDITWQANKGEINILQWLSRGQKNPRCYLLWSVPGIEGFQINISSITDLDLFFFPDSYWINFQSRRAVAVTRDADVIVCEPKQEGAEH